MIPLFKVRMSSKVSSKVGDVLSSGYIGQGEKVEEFEDQLQAELHSDIRPITVNSCTSALDLALELIGVGPGDEVVSTAQTCFASNSVILNRGARIIWADIDPITGNICPDSVAKCKTNSTKAIMAVNWAGRLCNYGRLKSHGIPVIEDAAHTWGINHNQHERGDYVAYSFQAIKFLTTGDGGCLIPPADKEHDARLLRWYGLDRNKGQSFRCTQNITKVGFKYHMNDIAASIGLANIPGARRSVLEHRIRAEMLTRGLKDVSFIITPPIGFCSYWLYTIVLNGVSRDDFAAHLTENNITSSPVHYRNDMYDCTADYKTLEPLPGLDSFSANNLSIPVGWWLSVDEIQHIIKTIKDYNNATR